MGLGSGQLEKLLTRRRRRRRRRHLPFLGGLPPPHADTPLSRPTGLLVLRLV